MKHVLIFTYLCKNKILIMVNKDIIIKLTNRENFKDMILMCLENDIDFSGWYDEISKYAPESSINYSMLGKEISFFHIYPNDRNFFFWISSGIKDETIKLTGVVNFYKYFYRILKIETKNYIFDVKPHKTLNDKCLKNWYISTDNEFFSIEYNIHGTSIEKNSEDFTYFANGDELTKNETKQYLLNKKLNKLKGKKTEPKKFPKKIETKKETFKKDNNFVYYIPSDNSLLLAC